MLPGVARLALALGAILSTGAVLTAQSTRLAAGNPTALPTAQDSARVLNGARSAQAGFERFRYYRLPRTSPGGRRCDFIIGRFCYWIPSDTSWRPPPEDPTIGRRRRQLVQALDSAAARIPGDPWVVGQRVRYHLEAADTAGALTAARGCRAERWWCLALEGYALHEARRYAESERAFEGALAAMEPAQAREWLDPSILMWSEDVRALRQAGEAERPRLVRRLWWLSDPLWGQPGNDRLTEHLTRWVLELLQDRARQVDRLGWRSDSREALLRYGWPVWWERYEGQMSVSFVYGVVSYEDPKSWEFLPPLSAARDPASIDGDEWSLEERPTMSRYAPDHTQHWHDLAHDLAVFRRGDAAILVGAWQVDSLTMPVGTARRAVLAAAADADVPLLSVRADPAPLRGGLQLRLPPQPTVVSLEVSEGTSAVAARARLAVAISSTADVSDLLLLADPLARPESLDEAVRLARGSSAVRACERLGVYWEVYGVAETDSLTLQVALVPGRAAWGRRQLEAIGVVGAARPVRVRWQEETEGGEIVGRVLAVALPCSLRPGDYTLEVTLEGAGVTRRAASRRLTVVD